MKKPLALFLIIFLFIAPIASANWFTDLFKKEQSFGYTQGVLPPFYVSSTEIVPRISNLDLHLDRSVILGNTSSTANGTIYYDGSDIYGIISGSPTSLTSGGGSGITSLNGETGASQTFATSNSDGLEQYITSGSNIHTFTLGVESGRNIPLDASTTEWASAYYITNEGTYTDTKYCTWDTDHITCTSEGGSGDSFTTTSINGLATTTFTFTTSSDTGLDFYITNDGVSQFTFYPEVQSGYIIPLTASTTNWNSFYNTPSTRITAGTNLSWDGNTLNAITGGGAGLWVTTSDELGIYPADTGDVVIIGANATTATGYDLEVNGSAIINGILSTTTLEVYGTSTLATTTATQFTFTNASGTNATLSNNLYVSGTSYLTGVTSTYATSTSLFTTNGSSTNFTVSGNSYLGTVVSGTWNGSAIDISDYTNLTASNGIQLNGDNIEPATNYSMPLTASTTEWANAYNIVNSSSTNWDSTHYIVNTSSTNWDAAYVAIHDAVTITGQDYLSLSGQQITANQVDEANIDFNSAPTDNYVVYWNNGAGKLDYTATTSWDTNTEYTAGGTLLDLTGTEFSVNEGTLTDGKYCIYTTGVGLVCNSEGGSGFTTTTINGVATTSFVFATSSDTNIGLEITTSTDTVTFTPTWIGTLADGRIESATIWNNLDTASSTWNTAAGLSHATATESVEGLEFSTQDLQLTSGYFIPTTTRAANWDYAHSLAHATATIAGSYDYITLSGQEFTLGQIDLTTDVTGLLPDGNIASADVWNDLDNASTSWTNAADLAHATATESVAGLEFSGQELQLTTDYIIPTSTDYNNWTTAYGWGDWNGNIDISTDTNLSVSATGLTLNGDDIELTATYIIPTSTAISTWYGKQDALTFGILDTNSVVIDGSGVADNDYAKFTASGLEGRSYSEVKTDLSLDNVENTALSTWGGSANIDTLGTITTGVWNGTAIDISSYTNLVAGTNITLSGDTLNVDDAFILNTGDTATGDFTFSGGDFTVSGTSTFATTTIVGNTYPTTTANYDSIIIGMGSGIFGNKKLTAGDNITITTTSDAVTITGASGGVTTTKAFTLFGPEDTDDDIAVYSPAYAITITEMYCITDSGTTTITLTDGTNDLDSMVCGPSGTEDDGTIANASFNRRETVYFDTSNTTSSPSFVNFTFSYEAQ